MSASYVIVPLASCDATRVGSAVLRLFKRSGGENSGIGGGGDIKVVYRSLEQGASPSFMTVAKRLNIMDSIKAKVPRCAYLGALSLRLPGSSTGQRLFVVREK